MFLISSFDKFKLAKLSLTGVIPSFIGMILAETFITLCNKLPSITAVPFLVDIASRILPTAFTNLLNKVLGILLVTLVSDCIPFNVS